jgi:hypothetical protein
MRHPGARVSPTATLDLEEAAMPSRMKTGVPIFPCADLETMIAFYVDRLGFERR